MKARLPRRTAGKMTSQGRVTVPKWVRDILGIGPGSKLTFDLTRHGEVLLRAEARKPDMPSRFARLRGCATVKMRTDEILALTRGD